MGGEQPDRINIRPEVSILSVLGHLNYRPWFAFAEFVDNALQSFHEKRDAIREVDGPQVALTVSIDFDQGERIVIRDNAGGISLPDFQRAFKPAKLPPDRTGLSEFGMGMKSAACWLAPVWSVRTKALGEEVVRTVKFDIAQIVRDSIEDVRFTSERAPAREHYTELILEQPRDVTPGRTLGKIRQHLADIYRMFIREEGLRLIVKDELLAYQEPPILVAPAFDSGSQPRGEPLEWRKDIEMDLGEGLRASGFAAIRKKASTNDAGFSLFRRKRLIQGSGDEKYRPGKVFGRANDYAYQRVFGELSLEGFEVSHTKDGFRWEEHEEVFIDLLLEELEKAPLSLITQARNYRVRPTVQDDPEGTQIAVVGTAETIRRHGPETLPAAAAEAVPEVPPASLPAAEELATRTFDIDLPDRLWRVVLEIVSDTGAEWVSVSETVLQGVERPRDRELIGIRFNAAHRFTARYVGAQREFLPPMLRIAAALGLAEKLARDGGVKRSAIVRARFNKILKDVMSRE